MDADGFRALFVAQFDDVWRFARRRCPSGPGAGLDHRLASVPPPSGAPDPADQVADADASPLWSALASLGDDDRELLLLRAWDELPVADIATLLGCTPNAASLRLHKARRRLGDALAAPAAPTAATAASTAVGTDPDRSRTRDGGAPNPGGGPR